MSEEQVDAHQSNSEIKRGRNKTRLNVFLAVSLAFATLLVANYCASLLYAHWQFDVKSNGGLSSRTLEFLKSSQGEIKITSLFERSHPFHKVTKNLLQEYAEAAMLIPDLDIKVKSLAVNHDIASATELMRRFPVEANSIIIEFGQQHRLITEDDMSSPEADGQRADYSAPDKRQILFNGERSCTSAMMELLHPAAAPVVYFVGGHGEYDPASQHQVTGASAASHALTLNGIIVKKLNLEQNGTIPTDCDVLVIAGPRTMYGQREIEMISTYLVKGGKAMFLIDDAYAGGLTTILNNWGIQVTSGDKNNLIRSHVSTTYYGDHPITKRLENIMTFFANPCTVDAITSDPIGVERADKPKTTRLIMISPRDVIDDHVKTQDPVSIAAASELGAATLTGRQHNTRLVVCGDSDFISNAMNSKGFAGNTVFLLSAIDWLNGKQARLTSEINANSVLNAGIDPESGWLVLSAVLAGVLPAIILIFGLLVYIPTTRRL